MEDTKKCYSQEEWDVIVDNLNRLAGEVTEKIIEMFSYRRCEICNSLCHPNFLRKGEWICPDCH